LNVELKVGDGGSTGTVDHIIQLSGIKDGKQVIGNGVGVSQIGWNEEEMR
jgi:hypothetical protein